MRPRLVVLVPASCQSFPARGTDDPMISKTSCTRFIGCATRAAIMALSCLALFACAPSQSKRVAQGVNTLKTENTPQRLTERGKAFAGVGDLTRAEQYLTAAIEAGGEEREILPILLSVCIADKKLRVAIDYAEDYLRRHPGDQKLRFVAASLYAATDQTPKAIENLESVLRTNPSDAEAHYTLAVLLRDRRGDRVGADEHFRRYLDLDPRGTHVDEAQGSLLKQVAP